jgi:N utilization substance protein A
VGEVINGIIKRQEMGDFIVDMGRAESVLPRKEQSRAETYQTGDRVRVAIVRVLKSAKGPQVVVSRTDPALLVKLFEMEVPEIYDGTVQIRGCVREAGERAKVAVVSREKDVDPVGACVGMKGTRVQSIIRELRGEKIDIVEWSEDPVAFVEKALSPAKISRVSIVDEEQKIMEVVVEDKQLSLAIGKKGQNVRLAAKLVGWRIDIKSEEEKRQEVEAHMARMARIVDELRSLPHVGEKTIQKLIDVGVEGLEHILEMTDEQLCSIEGVGPKTAEKIRQAAQEAKVEWDRRDAEEAARVEAERLAAEQAAAEEAARVAEEQAAAEAAAVEEPLVEEGSVETAEGASAEAEAEAAAVAGVEPGEGGKPDGER